MAMTWEQVTVDASDPVRLGRWWAEALDWVVVNPSPDEFEIQPAPGVTPGMIFVRVPEGKRAKNRMHIDLRPDGVRDSEVARLLMLGATRVNVGQNGAGRPPWTVLADPEGNEFCVLGLRTD
ncbi:VOC family protein [Pseudonocardia nematodicida]|uniref:VOC family protein n=1 Tax=Pseudonocardia nematodicida TaxID=1206997 RepID=A0ABV1KAS2_9PSEU